MDIITCKNCVHRVMIPDPATRELASFCTRHPPQVLAIVTPQGIAVLTQYPKVDVTFPSCGDFEPPEEERGSERGSESTALM